MSRLITIEDFTDVYVNKAGAENERKVPILTAMEILRKDVLSYSNQLMLNPKSLGEVVEQEKIHRSLRL